LQREREISPGKNSGAKLEIEVVFCYSIGLVGAGIIPKSRCRSQVCKYRLRNLSCTVVKVVIPAINMNKETVSKQSVKETPN